MYALVWLIDLRLKIRLLFMMGILLESQLLIGVFVKSSIEVFKKSHDRTYIRNWQYIEHKISFNIKCMRSAVLRPDENISFFFFFQRIFFSRFLLIYLQSMIELCKHIHENSDSRGRVRGLLLDQNRDFPLTLH